VGEDERVKVWARDGQSGPGPGGNGAGTIFLFLTETGARIFFSPGPRPGRNFFSPGTGSGPAPKMTGPAHV